MMYTQNDNVKIGIIGGGAAGLMAAGVAINYGAEVTVFDHSGRLGKKLAITGKGRCNVTNNSDINTILENVTSNPRFLYAALNAFPPADVMSFFESLGVELKTERGNRVFPVSDKAIDIVNALKDYSSAARFVFSHVKEIKNSPDGDFTVVSGEKVFSFDKVIIATGGRSYPLTGSDGSGYRLAIKLGHTVTEIKPSLIPLESRSEYCERMQGLSLKNVAITVSIDGKKSYSDFGEMMFTHFGVTGPMILSASAHLKDADITKATLSIDLKPALDEKTLDERLLSDFSKTTNKDFINSLDALLPSKMIPVFVDACGVDPRKKVNSITKEERRRIVATLKSFEIPLCGFRPIEEAIITSGGVNVKEVSPKSMESKIVKGLYFAGEVLDVDAYTGGFNLQIAFSTGYLAGMSAATE